MQVDARPIRAVLFDLDQTLTDRPASIAKIAQRFAKRFKAELSCDADTVCDCMNRNDLGGYRSRDDFFIDLLDQLPWREKPNAQTLESFWRQEFHRCTVATEGAIDVMRTLHQRGLRLGIITNGKTAMQSAKIEFLGFGPYLTSVTISESVGVKKPDPRIFQAALEALGVEAAETILVGDHPSIDVVAARDLGMKAVWLSGCCEWPSDLPPAKFVITKLPELLEII
jgi:putative hydrolase of the HAD superfamily